MSLVIQNTTRLNHLLALFKLSKEDFLHILNEGNPKKIGEEEVFAKSIKISLLNKIDKIFNKGISYYVNPFDPHVSPDESIFFRKDDLNASLNLSAKKIVNKFEEEKLTVDTLLKLSEIENPRILPIFKVSDSPEKCASLIRTLIYPAEKTKSKAFLKNLISNLAEKNVLVFEFVEGYNKKEKANVNGFYLSPNVIVLKWQKYTKREIFTLAHEIGHYILNEEDIDERINPDILSENINAVEKWCNDFAFHFLAGEYAKTLQVLENARSSNDFYHDTINEISDETHLSTLSLYTKLLYLNKVTISDYKSISDETFAAIKKREEEEKKELEKKKLEAEAMGKTIAIPPPKAIISPLYLQTLQIALYNGYVDEYEFCQRLNISPNKIEDYLV